MMFESQMKPHGSSRARCSFIEVQGEDEMPMSLSREHAGEYELVESRVWLRRGYRKRQGRSVPLSVQFWLAFFAQAWLGPAIKKQRTPGVGRDGRFDAAAPVGVIC